MDAHASDWGDPLNPRSEGQMAHHGGDACGGFCIDF